MSKSIYPCLWFDGKAKAAADYYGTIFNNSKILSASPMVVQFEIEGLKIMGLNGGPIFTINPTISLFVTCQTNLEIETLYSKLLEGGSAMMPLDKYPWSEKYGWVIDQFGMTWQLMLGELPVGGQKITPSFLFVGKQCGNALKAIEQYTGLFPDSKIHHQELYQDGEAQPKGNLKFGHFTLFNKLFAAMDGTGEHAFQFNEAVSLVVECDTQEEIDYYWNKLTEGGEESRCGWLKDQYGVSWQIVPSMLGSIMQQPGKGSKVMEAIMKMKKLDIATLMNA